MMLMKRLLLSVSLAVLCLGVTPAMADMVNFAGVASGVDVASSVVTITADMGVFVSITDEALTTQSISMNPGSLITTLTFVGSGDDYVATGSVVVEDADGVAISAVFQSTDIVVFGGDGYGTATIHGYLTPQAGNQSILSENVAWGFSNGTDAIVLNDNAASYDTGLMTVFEFGFGVGSLEDFLQTDGSGAVGANVTGEVVPVPAAVLLGVLGMGMAGLRLRKES